MPRTEDAAPQDRIQEASRLASPAFPDIETSRRFTEALYHNVPRSALAGYDDAALADIAASLWRFVGNRLPGRPAIRLLAHPDRPGTGAVQIINDDMRFLVDSTQSALANLGIPTALVLHPIIPMQRDNQGTLKGFGNGGAAESLMHIELPAEIPADRAAAVTAHLDAVLADVRACIEDWPAMRAQVHTLADLIRTAPHLASMPEAADDAAFLEWLDDGNFLFLGTREYILDTDGLEVVGGAGRGLLRHDDFLVFDGLRVLTRTSPDVQAFLRGPTPTMISKSNRRSPIHRPAPMDTVIVKIFDADSKVTGLRLVIGLFTTDSYFRLPHEIPILRQKVKRCQARSGLASDSRDGRSFQHILDTFPRDELFQIDEDQLYETAIGVLHVRGRSGVALFVMRDPFERFCTCLVYMPRDRFDAEVGRRVADILEAEIGGSITHESTHFEDATLARLHYVIATPAAVDVSVPDVERRLTEALRTWSDRLAEALSPHPGAAQRLRRYATAFPASYRNQCDAATALADMESIDAVLAGAGVCVTLSSTDTIRLRITHANHPLALSDVLPMLENLGVRVISEIPFEVSPRDHASVWVQVLELQSAHTAFAGTDAERFEEAFRAVWSGTAENDGFNRLVLLAGLSAREVTVLRAYCKLLRQAGSMFSQTYMEDALAAHPSIAAALVHLFDLRFNPAIPGHDDSDANAAILESLEAVSNLDEDRILRSFLLLIRKTLRTNHYQPDASGAPKAYLSLKLASREIDLLPQPRPLVEIFVCSPRMEGCHLRGGRVARGGIRWSDRREDFRTEVLGLMKAQMVKNAVIVPIGSKGGFVLKQPPSTGAGGAGGREAMQTEAIACYRILMSGLLDLTDNIVGADILPPASVVCHDAPDTYLVVAADKGTATFSDIANGVAIDYGFWLGDAFASGGSIGYDHKVMGITAKGAWEAVKRHFREIGKDIQAMDFTCVGVGDMSGDVFGNGMMLSKHTQLIAAFNHMHIFLDPDPDPAASWLERCRLFALPRSTWLDYSAALISKGGGVFDRKAKSIPLSSEVRARFGIAGDTIAPNDLIRVLLRHDADLLWFGGIGTYVKASTESQSDAGDRANDALRIDATELRAKVVGEGANLAITQRARIEFALRSGRINTDAIDNSAGVDTSDHEVNIKIAAGDVIAAGFVPQSGRTEFLASMTTDVEHLVLVDNYLQTQALTLAEAIAPALLDSHAHLMRAMERQGRLDRAVEFLPDDDTIAQRASARRGLTRPEIAVLLAYAKNTISDDLIASSLADAPEMRAELLAYFPKRLRDLAPDTLAGHRLRREIIATCVANALVNRMGPSFAEDARSRTGGDVASIARAFLIVRDVFGLEAIWRDIEALDNKVPAATQTHLFHAVSAIVEQAIRWFLLSGHTLDHTACVEAFQPGVRRLAGEVGDLLPERERIVNAGRAETHRKAGVPEELGARIVVLNTLSTAMDIVQISKDLGRDIIEVGRLYLAVGVDYGTLTLRRQARAMPTATHWQRLAADAIVDDSYVQQRAITRDLLARGASSQPAEQGTALAEVLTDIIRTSPPDLAMLTVASRRIRTAASR